RQEVRATRERRVGAEPGRGDLDVRAALDPQRRTDLRRLSDALPLRRGRGDAALTVASLPRLSQQAGTTGGTDARLRQIPAETDSLVGHAARCALVLRADQDVRAQVVAAAVDLHLAELGAGRQCGVRLRQ